jgi:hydrogenase nickel incorporation protein HypB
MFRAADLVLLTKIDLAPHLPDFRPDRARDYLQQLATEAQCTELSAQSGAGMDDWIAWLAAARDSYRHELQHGHNRRPHLASEGQLLHATDNVSDTPDGR